MSNQPRILIVDDVLENIQVAMNFLHEENYDLSFATLGEEAITLVNQEVGLFDLILLDVAMPGLNGFDTCTGIKENPINRDIPIIFLTAKVDIDSISKGFALGAVDYITKPFHAEELLARVRTHVDLFRARKLLLEHNIALGSKINFQRKRLLSELEDNQKEMIWILTELMEATSDETGKHIRRVAEICSLLAHYHPALDEGDAEILFHASPMHDIGKMTIPHHILHKPGRLTKEEFEVMKTHTSNAYDMLSRSPRKLITAAAVIAHEHHEKWNGSGYPRGLKGADIHIYGRIVALADVFDALTHSRRYKEPWTIDKVVTYIEEHSETQFDPELVEIFLQHLDEFVAIANIE